MAAKVDSGSCVGCGGCVDVCPVSCIEIKNDVANIGDDCASCGACADACPASAITVE